MTDIDPGETEMKERGGGEGADKTTDQGTDETSLGGTTDDLLGGGATMPDVPDDKADEFEGPDFDEGGEVEIPTPRVAALFKDSILRMGDSRRSQDVIGKNWKKRILRDLIKTEEILGDVMSGVGNSGITLRGTYGISTRKLLASVKLKYGKGRATVRNVTGLDYKSPETGVITNVVVGGLSKSGFKYSTSMATARVLNKFKGMVAESKEEYKENSSPAQLSRLAEADARSVREATFKAGIERAKLDKIVAERAAAEKAEVDRLAAEKVRIESEKNKAAKDASDAKAKSQRDAENTIKKLKAEREKVGVLERGRADDARELGRARASEEAAKARIVQIEAEKVSQAAASAKASEDLKNAEARERSFKDAKSGEEITAARAEISRLSTEIADANKRAGNIGEKNEEARAALRDEITRLTGELGEARGKLKSSTDASAAEKDALEADLTRLVGVVGKLKSQADSLEVERVAQEAEITRMEEEKVKLEAKIGSSAAEKLILEGSIRVLTDELSKANSEVVRAAESKIASDAENVRLAEDVERLKAEVERLTDEADEAEKNPRESPILTREAVGEITSRIIRVLDYKIREAADALAAGIAERADGVDPDVETKLSDLREALAAISVFTSGRNVGDATVEMQVEALDADINHWVEKEAAETDPIMKKIFSEAVRVENLMKNKVLIEAGLKVDGENEEVMGIVRDGVDGSDQLRLERLKKWFKKNWPEASVAAVTVAGLIVGIVSATRTAVRAGASAVGRFAGAVARVFKKLGPLFAALGSILATAISWGARGLAWIASNLWFLVVVGIAALYSEYGRRKQARETRHTIEESRM